MPETIRANPTTAFEQSYVWGGQHIGDAIYAPYDHQFWRSFHRATLNAMWMTNEFCVLPTNHSSYSGLLAPSNPAGTTLRIASGAALVDGYLYTNDANVDFACPDIGYYLLVIRGDITNRNIDAKVLGPSSTGYPEPAYVPNQMVEIPIARVRNVTGSTLVIADRRTFFRNIRCIKRKGGAAQSYLTAGSTEYVAENVAFEMGIFAPGATTGSENYPESYNIADPSTFGNDPIVFLMGFATANPSTARLVVTAGTGVDFSWQANSITSLDKVIWLSIGGVQTRDALLYA